MTIRTCVLTTLLCAGATALAGQSPAGQPAPSIESLLEVVDISTGSRRVVHRAPVRFEAPNWSHDGQHLLINQEGGLFRVPMQGGAPVRLDTGEVTGCNNDHGYSPDGTLLAISCGPRGSRVYVMLAQGGVPRLLTTESPSYWHGWSPDGQTLAYVAQRQNDYDIYTIPVAGGSERRLTTAPGLDDGPDYSSDGAWIYFNSERTGAMRLWRMRTDGQQQEQVTFDDRYADWFPHPSPDGRWLVWLSYNASVKGHPPDKDVVLRIMPLAGGQARVLVELFGGQGTINVPSWSPDSHHVAFVSYRRRGA